MQKTEIIGHLGKDAEVKEFGENNVINFSVAVTEKWTNKDGEKQSKTTWYECAKWGKHTGIADYLKKGTQVYIQGKSEPRAWIKDNEAVAVNGLTVQFIELLGGKSASSVEVNEPSTPSTESSEDLPF